MIFEEIINDNGHILLWQPEIKYRFNSSKILGMDLDWTFIKPIKGKIHPIDEYDWEFLNKDLSRIKTKIDEGYKFVIFTNQGGLLNSTTGKMDLEGFKKRWYNIYDILQNEHDINSVYLMVSLHDDFNRKPCTGMWEYVEKVLNNKIVVKKDSSLYVGDMAGRKGNYSSTDLLFALNLGVSFQVPEVFYGDSRLVSNSTSVLIKNVEKNDKIFKGKKFIEEFDKKVVENNKVVLDEIKKLLLEYQCLVLFVGSPASGKTSYYNNNLQNLEKQIYFSTDIFNGTPGKFNKEIEKTLNTKISVIIDNTNSTIKTREKYIKIARNINKEKNFHIKIIVVKFNTKKEITLHLNTLRTKIINTCVIKGDKDCKHNVPAVAIHSYWKRFEELNKEKEDIDYIFNIEYEPIFNNKNDKNNNSITKKMFIEYV
jgi:bifunctional polynucleotide phosphatase/kinase